jgi:YD repeat-containing protein
MQPRNSARHKRVCALILLTLLVWASGNLTGFAANGSVVYTYDALGRVLTASYDTRVIVIYTYDANGNRTQQVVNVIAPQLYGAASM